MTLEDWPVLIRHNAAMNSELTGFVLTRQWQEKDNAQQLLFWMATDRGPLLVEVEAAKSVCFVAREHQSRVQQVMKGLPGSEVSEVALKSFSQQEVLACYFQTQKHLNQFKSRLGDQMTLYEADVRPTDRFLMERFLQAEVSVSGEITQRDGYLYCVNPNLRAAPCQPKLKIASLDIETSYTENILYSIAVSIKNTPSGDVSIVMMVGEEVQKSQLGYLQFYENEKALLMAFLEWFLLQDPDVIIGWAVVGFDLNFLQKRCDYYSLPFSLGRNTEKVTWRSASQSSNKQFALVPGRVVLDGIELLRTATYQFESFSLENVARELLGRGKLIHDVDARGAEIQQLFANDKTQLAKYNLEDCNLVHDIFDETDLLDFALERSRLTGLDIDRAGGSVAAFDFLYLPKLHRRGYVAPVVPEDARGGAPGGYVLESAPGVYSDVIVLDFKSLYPSIIRTFHVDPLALVEGEFESSPIPGYKGASFSREQVLLPGIIEELWTARDKAKQQKRSAMSQAIKIIMNSFYGVLGTPGCRFFDDRLVSSITLRGHEILQTTRDLIEERGYQVIYGDTDSVFVLVDQVGTEAVSQVGSELTDYLNSWWREHIRQEYDVKSCLEVEFETHFKKFLMPRVRGSEKGSKKRYAGVVDNQGVDELVFKGLETVRSDWSPLAREFQQKLYQKIFNAEAYESYIRDIVKSVVDAPLSELTLRKRLRRSLVEYQKNVPPHVRAARLADDIRKKKGLAPIYDDGGWIEYVITVAGPEPVAYVSQPIDLEFYVSRQLAPIADAILCFEDNSLAKVLDKQLSLF